jgi:uncharacterized membrane protein
MIEFGQTLRTSWLIIGVLLLAVLLGVSYWFARGNSHRGLRLVLAGLRWTIIAAVLVCLLNPEWVETIKHQKQARFAVLLDTSRSMGTKDLEPTRLAAGKQWLKENLVNAAPAGIGLEFYGFSDSVTNLDSLDSANATGTTTGLAGALESLLTVSRDEPLTGVLLCSDGIENMRRDPEALGRLYYRKGIPIHALTVGTTNDVRDIVVENVQVKRAVANQAPTKIGVILRSFGYPNQSIPVRVLFGNQVVASQTVKLKDGQQKIDIDFTPRQRGFQIYEVQVPVQPGEWLATNNRRVFGLEVIDPRIQVIYMEGTPQQSGSPIPEWKYLKDALQSDPNIHVKVLYRQFGGNGQFLDTVDADPETGEKIYPVEHPTQGFPRTLEGLLQYDVIIHSDIKKESFSPEQLQNMARLVQEFGGGFVMIGGHSAFGQGGYHRTILDRIIPVAMEQENDSQPRPFHVRVPPAALAHPLMALGATRAETEQIWTTKFPYLYGCNRVDRAKPGAVVLAEDPSSANSYGPRLIMAVQNVGKGRSMAFTSDTTRSWGRDFETIWGERINDSLPLMEDNCDRRYYRQFWVNAVRWLAAGRILRTNNPVTLELTQTGCLPGEHVGANVKVRDTALKVLSTADVSLLLSSAGRTNPPVKATFDSTSQSFIADLITPRHGDFLVTAVVTANDRKLGEDHQLLVCESGDREMADLRARPELMANLARLSGGKTLSMAQPSGSDISSVFGTPPPETIETRRSPLWDRWWWLGAVLFLLTAEWATRRLNGMA